MEVHPAVGIPDVKHVDTSPYPNHFDKLVTSLTKTLSLSSDLMSDDINVALIMRLMRLYDSQEHDWARYAFGDSDTDYTRNLVDEGNGKGNLVSRLHPEPSQSRGSPVHDHGNAHCVMKILKGSLTETRYAFPPQGPSHPLDIISEKTHGKNEVIYMSDELGVHRMFNAGKDFAVSLHYSVYTPPHVALKGCCIFDEGTGGKLHIPSSSYYSAFGRLLKEEK
ncbi:cysteine dioxygenase [Xylaria curta]|nr:cysteine dioxygenase [Xylaria curta]